MMKNTGSESGVLGTHGVKLHENTTLHIMNVRQARAMHADKHVSTSSLCNLLPAAELRPIDTFTRGSRQLLKQLHNLVLVDDTAPVSPALNLTNNE